MDNLIDRLRLQSDAFQDSFNLLSRAKTLEELAKVFFQILRGSLLALDAAIFFKSREEAEWQVLFSRKKCWGVSSPR